MMAKLFLSNSRLLSLRWIETEPRAFIDSKLSYCIMRNLILISIPCELLFAEPVRFERIWIFHTRINALF